ncbi:MAG TPA: hypothetical protein VN770_11845 [Gaiellaceae bacterium]|nr:hypothetical protein [Gaiellaceae bacterium]
MATKPEIRHELAGEREQLTDAVADLREELGHAAERGKRVGMAVAAAGGLVTAARLALRLRRR